MPHKLVVMGVSGSGKTTLAAHLARRLDADLVEGDDHHLPASKAKMRQGIPLDDADREPWLNHLGDMLAGAKRPMVLTCSALKRRYRDRLRERAPGLRFVYIDIDEALATARVQGRTGHSFPASLVASQFQTLEPPLAEGDVLAVPATQPSPEQVEAVLQWLASDAAASDGEPGSP